jgi:hypothetical protein
VAAKPESILSLGSNADLADSVFPDLLLLSFRGCESVTKYRLYCISPDGRVLGPAESLEASDDKEALKAVKALMRPTKCEVWQRTRFVGEIPSRGMRG